MVWCHARTLNNKKEKQEMKLLINGTKIRGFKGVDRNGNPYQFIVVGGSAGGKMARAVFNNAKLYGAITSAPGLTILDTVEVEALVTRNHTFMGRDGKTVTVIEATDPMPTGIGKSAFPATETWPDWNAVMETAKVGDAGAGTEADAAAAEDSEAEF